MCGGVRFVCERVRRGLWGSRAVRWPLAPRGHAPLRSLAEGSAVVCCDSSVAARHRGAEEEILFMISCKYFLIRC
jgi:hypothetical protein